MAGDDNSGVFVGFPPSSDPWSAVNNGYEIQIDATDAADRTTGSVYGFKVRRHRRPRRGAQPAGRVEHLRAAGRGRAAPGLPQRREDQRLHQHRPGPHPAPATSASRTTAPATTCRSATSGSRSWAARAADRHRARSSALAGKCLDVGGGSTADGTQIQLWTCNGGAAQKWTRHRDSTLRALGKCLDVTGGGTANGAKVQLWTCNGSGAQNWTAQPNGSLRNPQSGKCLDANGGSSADGTQLHLWTCHGGANQRWTLP